MLRVEHAAEIARKDERIAELEDRLMAQSLAELRAFRPVAMHTPPAEPAGYWVGDETGLSREFVADDSTL